jgi:hypothetical protein
MKIVVLNSPLIKFVSLWCYSFDYLIKNIRWPNLPRMLSGYNDSYLFLLNGLFIYFDIRNVITT